MNDEDLKIEVEEGPELELDNESGAMSSKDESSDTSSAEDVGNPYDEDESHESNEANKAAKLGKSAKRSRNIRAKLDRADSIEFENRQMREELARLKQEQQHLTNLAKQFTSETLDDKIDKTNNLITFYQQEYAKAISAADGNSAAIVMKEMSAEQQKAAQLKWQKEQLVTQTRMPSAPQVPVVDPLETHPETIYYKTEFLKDHPWMADRRTSRDDINLVLELDRQVFNEGYKMNTPAYWDNLERKMRDYMPDRFESENKVQEPARRSHVGASVTNSTPAAAERGRMRFKDYQADVLVRLGYLSEDRKTVLNKDKVKEYHNQWNKG